MPDEIKGLLDLDYKALFSSLVIVMVGWVSLKTLLEKFSNATGIEMPWNKREREQREQLKDMQERVSAMEDQIKSITENVNEMRQIVNTLSETVRDLGIRQDANEAAKLKDRISESYRYFHEIGEWTDMDKESFKDLIAAYSQYSSNSFVHDICEKEMETWKIVER